MRLMQYSALILLTLSVSCSQKSFVSTVPQPPSPPASSTWPLSDAQVQSLLSKRMFFGHQSVGTNIVQGIQDLMSADSRLAVHLVSSSNPGSVTGAAFIESPIGSNGDPTSKDWAFAAIVNNGVGAQGGIAMYKYCYVDINDSSDVQQIFHNYQANLETLKTTYPAMKVVPITVPLATTPSKGRNDFNNLVRQAYSSAPIFDLAEVESTHSDGSRSYSVVDGENIYTLAPEYTTDGGHLNEVGSSSGQTTADYSLKSIVLLNPEAS